MNPEIATMRPTDMESPRRPRVLCFGRFYDDIPGGMQRHVEHLFSALRNDVDYVHLVPSRNGDGAVFRLHGAPVVRTPSLSIDGSLALSPGLVAAARSLHDRKPFDLVHLHFPDPMSHLASLAIPAHVPRVVSWHADITRQKRLLQLYRPLLRRIVSRAAAIIVATPAHITSSPELADAAQTRHIDVIPYGFELERYTAPDPRAAAVRHQLQPSGTDVPIIFALGRHVYYKGFDVLIEAMASVPPPTRLVIGGVGPLTDGYRSRVRQLGLDDRIVFPGLIPEDELPAWYQACDVFCLPATSTAEAFGIVQVEAMASARPVVTTRLGNGVEEVGLTGVTGLTVPPSNSTALASALNDLLADRDRCRQMGQAARVRAVGEFAASVMGQRTLAVYHRSQRRDTHLDQADSESPGISTQTERLR